MKVALLLISTGENYHQYINPLVESARKHFLKKHDVEFLLWTDSKKEYDVNHKFHVEHMAGGNYPSLMRYHMFLQQEELLKTYDYLFFCDVDMLFVDEVGDEILGPGLTVTQHPGYAFRPIEEMDFSERMWFYPFERNIESSAFIDVPRYYFAGGFQGGYSDIFIGAMWNMKRGIDSDFEKNYITRWHDESHWNRYCYQYAHHVTNILNPSYCYPVPYPTPTQPPYETIPLYKKIWGKDYKAKLLCLTKQHQLSKEGGDAMTKIMKDLNA